MQPPYVHNARSEKCRYRPSHLVPFPRFTLDTNAVDDRDADSGMTMKNMLTRPELCGMRFTLAAFNSRLFARSLLLATPLSSGQISLSVLRISLPSHPRARNLAGVPI